MAFILVRVVHYFFFRLRALYLLSFFVESLLAPCCASRSFVRFVRFIVGSRVLIVLCVTCNCVHRVSFFWSCRVAFISVRVVRDIVFLGSVDEGRDGEEGKER